MKKLLEIILSLFRKEEKPMTHIKQNDIRCKHPIPEIGCFFRSCGLIAEYHTKKELTADMINQTWDWAKESKRIDSSDNIKDSASIATRFLRLLGDNGRFIEVGLFRDGKTQYYPAFVSTPLARCDALIQKVATDGKYGTHFRMVDAKGVVMEDPHEPPIKAKSIYYSILYAYEKGE